MVRVRVMVGVRVRVRVQVRVQKGWVGSGLLGEGDAHGGEHLGDRIVLLVHAVGEDLVVVRVGVRVKG